MLFVDLKKLYGKERSKVWIHFDSASSHVAKETYAWLDKHGFNYITKDEWLANSPEVSPMDYFANGYLKKN